MSDDVRKVHDNGGSTVVSLSNEAQAELGISLGDYVQVTVRDGEVVLRSIDGL